MKPASFYILPAIMLLALIACSNTDDSINYEDLLGVVWNIDSLQTPDTTIVASKIEYSTIQFTEDLGVIGHVDLMEYHGIYEITGNGLLIEVVEPTGWGCSRPRMRCIFFDALETVTAYEVNEDRLCLYQGDSYILYFHPSFIEEELLDKVWKVDSLQTLETKIVPGDTLMTIQFNKNMIVNGLAACNEYTGIYEIGENRSIAIDVLYGTEMDCGVRLETLEDNFINSLEKIMTYNMDEDRLTLYDSGRQYILSFSLPVIAFEQPDPIPYHKEAYFLNTGVHDGLTDPNAESFMAYREVIQVAGAPWLRLHFDDYNLDSLSYITITSLEDGGRQRLDAQSLPLWNNASAYFNGDAVEFELHVAPLDKGVFVCIREISVGE